METKLEQIAAKAVKQRPKSVVREIRTPRSVGTGGGRPPPVTRWAPSNGGPYRNREKKIKKFRYPVRFARDSLLEEAGFEPSVPRNTPAVVVISGLVAPPSPLRQGEPTSPSLETLVVSRGTDGSIRLVPAVSETNAGGGGGG